MLFAVDNAEKILGTFFSKGEFIFTNNEKSITGTDIMWLPIKNENEYNFDNDELKPSNIKYLFYRNTSNSFKTIYQVTKYEKYDNNIINLHYTRYEIPNKPYEIPTEIDNIEYISNFKTNNLITKIKEAHKNVINGLEQLEQLKQKGGGSIRFGLNDNKEFDTSQFNIMENLVNDFEKFVDAFITYPTVLKLNSLSVVQVNNLFSIDIVIDSAQIIDKGGNTIKKIIFEFLFYSFKTHYKHNNQKMITDVLKHFHDKINIEQTNKSTEIAKNIGIYEELDKSGNDLQINTIIHIKYLATMFTEMVISLKNDISSVSKSNINIINDVFYIIVDNITNISNIFQKKISINATNGNTKNLLYIIKGLEINNKNFITYLETCIKDNVSDKILTYVKINNLDHNFEKKNIALSKWNERFDVLLNSITDINPIYNTMIVKYNDINKPYYDGDGELIEDTNNTEYTKQYTKQYLFGKFSKIFPPNMKNPDIANQMTQIVEKVKDGKPVFIMGYGASGSGKTSSLIYLDNKGRKEDGIIIDICKEICKDSFNKLELTTEEIFTNDEPSNKSFELCETSNITNITNITKCISNVYTFNYDENNEDSFVLEKTENTEKIKHPYRNPGDIPKTFGEILKYLIDSDRLVKATTNNPQSSRSHSFAFIQFICESKPKNGYLIVGDFAGVENTFNCDNIVTIRDFLNIKNKDTDETYYGGNHSYTDNVDRIITDYIYLDERVYGLDLIKINEKLDKINESLLLTVDNRIFKMDVNKFNIVSSKIRRAKLNVKEKFLTDYEKEIRIFCDKYIEYANNVDGYNIITKTSLINNANSYKETVSEVYSSIEEKQERIAKQEKERQERIAKQEKERQERIAKQEKKIIAKLLQDEETRKKQKEAIEKARQERITKEQEEKERQEKERQKRIEQEEKIAKEQQQEEEKQNAEYIELSEKEINKDYLLDQINAIYKNYQTKLLDKMNSPKKSNQQKKSNEPNNLDEEKIKTYFNEFMKNILKNQFIKDNLEIDMATFSNYQFKEMYDVINTIINKINNIKIQGIKDLVKNINELKTKYITYEEIHRSPYSIQKWNDNWNMMIGNYKDKYKSAKFKPDINNNIHEEIRSTNIVNDTVFKTFINKYVSTDDYIEERTEKMNSHLFTNEYLKTTKTDLVYNKTPNQFVNQIFDLEIEILKKVILVLTNILNRLEYGKRICEYRRHEGYFINESLKEMREDIKNIFYVKQSDSIFISPNYVNLCLEKYCPTHSDCFKNDVQQKNIQINSVIFQKIFNYLDNKEYFKEVDKESKIENFYENILISVFCVLNISRSANNPPSVPYIDINELKIALKKYEKNKTYLDELKNNFIDLKTNLEKTKYKITGKYTSESTQPENTFDEFQTSSIQHNEAFKYIFTGDTSLISKLNSKNSVYQLLPYDFNFLYELIEIIDNNNAVSAIGTLEFLDQISKYHTTNTICFLDDDQTINTTDYINIYDNHGKFNLVDISR